MKPYFVLDNMVAALFDTAGRLLRPQLRAAPGLPGSVYPDVRAYEVRGEDGKAVVGLFLHG